MKTYLKHTFLLILYHPVAYLAGGLIAGFPNVILAAIFETNREPIVNVVQPISLTLVPLFFIFFFLQRDAYESRRFSPLMIIGMSLPFFILQLICILSKNYGMTIVGSVGIVTSALFPNTENTNHYILVLLGLQLLVHLPTYLFASYFGYWRRKREIKKMIEEHDKQIK